MNVKKNCCILVTLLSIIVAFNGNVIKSNAERYVSSDEYVSYDHLKKGDEFVHSEEDLFAYRVLKTAKETKSKRIEVEIIGFNPAPKHEYTTYDYEHPSINGDRMQDWGPYEIVGIANNAFKDNKNIRSFSTEGLGIRYIGKSAFEGCTNLSSFSINREGLKRIKSRAFYNCISLRKFVLEIDKLNAIGKDSLKNTKSKIKISIDKTDARYISRVGKLFKKAGAKKVNFKLCH